MKVLLFLEEITVSEEQLLLFSGPINSGGLGVMITSFSHAITNESNIKKKYSNFIS